MDFELLLCGGIRGTTELVALATAIRAATQYGCPITIVIPAKKNADNSPLKYIVSKNQAKQLLAGKFIRIDESTIAQLESNATLSTKPTPQVLLVIRGWSDVIPKIRKVSDVKSLVVIAPTMDEAEIWLAEFGDEHNK